MTTNFAKVMLPHVERASRQQHMFRWGTTIFVAVLAVFKLWLWAYLVLGIAVFATVIDIGLAVVVALSNLAAVGMTARPVVADTQRGSSQRAA